MTVQKEWLIASVVCLWLLFLTLSLICAFVLLQNFFQSPNSDWMYKDDSPKYCSFPSSVLTRWDLDFCLWHPIMCWKLFSKWNCKGSSCPHTALGSLNSQGMFSASWLWGVLCACFIFAPFWPYYKTLLPRYVLPRAAHELDEGCSCSLDKTWCNKEVQGFGFNFSIQCFFVSREVGLWGKFLQGQEGEGQEKQRM